MRRAVLAAALLVLGAAAPARSSPDDVGAEAGASLLEMPDHEESWDPSFAIPDERVVDVDGLPEPLRPLVSRLLADPLRIDIVAFRRRGRGAADAFLASDAALAGPADLAALRAELAAGSLVEAGRTHLRAEPGETVAGEDLDEVPAATGSDIESAIGVSVAFPQSGRVRTGLSARVRPVAAADGAWLVRFRAHVGADAVLGAVETVAGPRRTAQVAAFGVTGAATLRTGDTAVARGVGRDGAGFVLLVRASYVPDVRLPARLAGDWLAVPGAVLGDAGAGALVDALDGRGDVTWSLDDPLDLALDEALGGWDEPLGRPRGEPAWAAAATELVRPELGVVFLRSGPGAGEHLAALAHEALALRVPRTLTMTAAGTATLVVPACSGVAVRGFLGTLRVVPDGLEFESGCDSCIQVAATTRRSGEGLELAALLDDAGGLEIDACRRVEEERRTRTFAARRSLPGHSSITFDDVSLPFVTERVLRVRTRVPPGGGDVAGELRVGVTGPLHGVSGLEPVDVGGTDLERRRVWLAPGGTARLLAERRTPHVVDWAWERSCGMTFRYPHVSHLSDGVRLVLRRTGRARGGDDDDRGDHVGAVDVTAALTRHPSIDLPAFDMRDGVVEVLRHPLLVLQTRYPWADLGRVASGAGGELRLDVPGAPGRAALRRTRVTAESATATVRHLDGAALLFVAGGRAWLPEAVRGYRSNHQSGEAVVAPVHRQDGVHLVLAGARGGLADGHATLRARPDRTSFELRKLQALDRPDTDLSLLLPDQLVRRIPLLVPRGRALTWATPGGMPGAVSIHSSAPSEEDDR